ncbi:class I SAM-dependent methyltransferase [Rhizobium multihospitium]|uniref:Methyltransferase domain-containing protein n=1 Tax=Rhizobium multihospitium TaxID=410764 RepID=A0A1C3XAQ9_9HYPH|nr:class I SAM-dependent methyltransferase [Rhizobium multihospitium]SCB49299.1 hypothetical protein GA0061103_0572 [Rhizobium multihospitium]
MTLDEIGLEFGTDKASNHHDFLRFYERRLSQLKERAQLLILEIGVYRGGSVRTWSKYFPQAIVVGLDVTPDCRKYESGNVYVRIGDATDSSFLFDVISEFGRPDLIIDDGSHRWDHQITSLQMLFPLLKQDGFYIVEDLDTSFEKHLENAPFNGFSAISAFDYLVKLSRIVTGDAALGSERPYDLFASEHGKFISSIEFGRRTAVIAKKSDPLLGSS